MPKVERRGIYQQTTENLKLLEVSQLSIRPHHVVARKSEFSFFLAHACMHECVCVCVCSVGVSSFSGKAFAETFELGGRENRWREQKEG